MSLVDYDYSSSESDDKSVKVVEPILKKVKLDEEPDAESKKFVLPSATAQLSKLKVTRIEPDYFDDPSQHEGRTRSFKHERGIWPTLVCIPVESSIVEDLQEICQRVLAGIVEMHTPKDGLHISLSRTVKLQFIYIDSFIETMAGAVKCIEKFHVRLRELKVYTNDTKTRTFLAMKVDAEAAEKLQNMINKVNKVMIDFRQPAFYDDPSFHMSFLWCLGDKADVINEKLDEIYSEFEKQLDFTYLLAVVQLLRCTIGFKKYDIVLKDF